MRKMGLKIALFTNLMLIYIPLNIENKMISMLFLNKKSILKILTIFPYFALYSELVCATYASFGGGRSLCERIPRHSLKC